MKGLLAGVVLLAFGAGASAQTADFTGTLEIFTGNGGGFPTDSIVISGSASGAAFDGSAFTIPASAFVRNASTPIGFTPNAAPNSIYTIRTYSNVSNQVGSFSGSGGVMAVANPLRADLGLVPLPNVFSSIVIPVTFGGDGTASGYGAILSNALTVVAIADSWTTGQVLVDDQTPSAPTATMATSGFVTGTNQLATDGTITLVTPFLLQIRGASNENRAGYAVLTLQFVPEPSALGLCALGLVLAGVAARRRTRS